MTYPSLYRWIARRVTDPQGTWESKSRLPTDSESNRPSEIRRTRLTRSSKLLLTLMHDYRNADAQANAELAREVRRKSVPLRERSKKRSAGLI